MTEPTLPPEPAKDASADELEADIAATRHQLGETIDALEDKLDVSAQAKRKVDQTKTQLAAKINTTKAQVTNKVTAVRTQATGKVAQGKARITDKVTQTKAKVAGKNHGASDEPGIETMYPAEGRVTDSPGASNVTFPGKASQTKAEVTDQIKNITTRLAGKVTEARTRTKAAGSDDDTSARPAQVFDGGGPAPATNSTDSTKTAFTSTAAAVAGKVGQTRVNLTGRASQFTARTRQDPRSALPVAGAVLAAVVVVGWLVWRSARKPESALQEG